MEKHQRRPAESERLPFVFYCLASVGLLGSAAYMAMVNLPEDPLNKDIWQHFAALRALIDNFTDPANPFVNTHETSRHFQPLWVGFAALGLAFDLSIWTLLKIAGFLSMFLLAVGIYVFGRAYLISPWAPLVLLSTMLFGWILQIQHTGMHSYESLLFTAAYPATYLISLSLILWALVIHALARPILAIWVAALVALNFTTHQLGAAIGLVVVGSLVLLWPNVRFKNRAIVSAAVVAGLGLSLLWPYFNPIMMVLRPGNSTWSGGPDFYSAAYLTFGFFPSALGLFGLLERRAWPFLLALAICLGAYLLGFAGVQIAARFMMPSILFLHIGLATYLLRLHTSGRVRPLMVQCLAILAAALVLFNAFASYQDYRADHDEMTNLAPDGYEAALALTKDIPDNEEVAALSLSAWWVVATGQKVRSIPWPEPGIHDLGDRQAETLAVFDPTLSAAERRETARALGIRTLILDTRFVQDDVLAQFSAEAATVTAQGSLRRFDLFD